MPSDASICTRAEEDDCVSIGSLHRGHAGHIDDWRKSLPSAKDMQAMPQWKAPNPPRDDYDDGSLVSFGDTCDGRPAYTWHRAQNGNESVPERMPLNELNLKRHTWKTATEERAARLAGRRPFSNEYGTGPLQHGSQESSAHGYSKGKTASQAISDEDMSLETSSEGDKRVQNGVLVPISQAGHTDREGADVERTNVVHKDFIDNSSLGSERDEALVEKETGAQNAAPVPALQLDHTESQSYTVHERTNPHSDEGWETLSETLSIDTDNTIHKRFVSPEAQSHSSETYFEAVIQEVTPRGDTDQPDPATRSTTLSGDDANSQSDDQPEPRSPLQGGGISIFCRMMNPPTEVAGGSEFVNDYLRSRPQPGGPRPQRDSRIAHGNAMDFPQKFSPKRKRADAFHEDSAPRKHARLVGDAPEHLIPPPQPRSCAPVQGPRHPDQPSISSTIPLHSIEGVMAGPEIIRTHVPNIDGLTTPALESDDDEL